STSGRDVPITTASRGAIGLTSQAPRKPSRRVTEQRATADDDRGRSRANHCERPPASVRPDGLLGLGPWIDVHHPSEDLPVEAPARLLALCFGRNLASRAEFRPICT